MRKQWYFLLCFCFCLVGCAKPEPHPVTQEEAEEMALKDAGIEEVYTIQTYLNSDKEYQVMFVSDHTLWNYEIEKDTGEIVEKDRGEILPPTRLASLRGGSFLFEDQSLKVEFSTTNFGSTWAISRTLYSITIC